MNVVDELKSQTNQDNASLRTHLYKTKGILSSYDGNRMIFHLGKKERFSPSASFNGVELGHMYNECNGLIINTETMTPLVIPLHSFKSVSNPKLISKFLAEDLYEMYYANDGTIINLYNYAGSWRISTNRGIDVGAKKWGSKTYSEIFEEVLLTCGYEINDFYALLDADSCYTFGFKHKSMHPLKSEYLKNLWFVQSVNLKTRQISTQCDFYGIQSQELFTVHANNRRLTYFNNMLSDTVEQFIAYGIPRYGIILKSKDCSRTGAFSHIFIESPLMKKIRNLYYHSKISKFANQLNVSQQTASIVQAYLCINTHDTFIQIFQHFSAQYDQLDEISEKLTNAILKLAQTGATGAPTIKEADCKKIITKEIVSSIYRDLSKVRNFNPHSKDAERYVRSFISTFKYRGIFCKLFDEDKLNL